MTETVETLKAKAVEATGLRDFGEDWFEQPLAAWVKDLAGPSLKESGRAFLARLAVTNLLRRLEVIDWCNRHPEIDDVAVPPILYITGLERSGTTLLHNLLALHPKSRALLRWELMRPARRRRRQAPTGPILASPRCRPQLIDSAAPSWSACTG